MLELIIGFSAFSGIFASLVDMCGRWDELDNSDSYAIMFKIAVIASFVPPVCALLGITTAYNISKVYMSICLLFILMFGLGNICELSAYKIPVLMEVIPCAISALSLTLQSMDIYAPISRFTWCILDVSFIVGKIILLNKKK